MRRDCVNGLPTCPPNCHGGWGPTLCAPPATTPEPAPTCEVCDAPATTGLIQGNDGDWYQFCAEHDQRAVAPAGATPAPTGAELIAAERRRQVDAEGYDPTHDDEHDDAALAVAASAYVHHAVGLVNGVCWPDDYTSASEALWPWSPDSWKPSDDPVRTLVKAGALIAAEIDRLTRRASRG